jgi:NADH-quinone oxidoreductase subunit D
MTDYRVSEPREEIILNMGPQHPATHGVLRFVVFTDGEVMRKAVPDMGFLHRGMEKLAEQHTYPNYMPYTDRINYLEAMFTNQVWAMGIERLLEIEVPQRAEYLRVICCELNRIANHCVTLGCISMDLGAYTPFVYLLREREIINDLFEELCGNRLTFNYMRVGGVSEDVPEGWLKRVKGFLDKFDKIMVELGSLISGNEILLKRLLDIAPTSPEDSIAYGLVGPNLRAAGVDFDLRRDLPYSVYPDFDFEIPVAGKEKRGTPGDCFCRWVIREKEMVQSSRIVRQAINKLPDGEILAKVPRKIKPPKAEIYTAVEGARGEIGVYLVSDGSLNPYRAKWRTSSFSALSMIEHISPGLMIADLVAVIATMDTIAPEMDR